MHPFVCRVFYRIPAVCVVERSCISLICMLDTITCLFVYHHIRLIARQGKTWNTIQDRLLYFPCYVMSNYVPLKGKTCLDSVKKKKKHGWIPRNGAKWIIFKHTQLLSLHLFIIFHHVYIYIYVFFVLVFHSDSQDSPINGDQLQSTSRYLGQWSYFDMCFITSIITLSGCLFCDWIKQVWSTQPWL